MKDREDKKEGEKSSSRGSSKPQGLYRKKKKGEKTVKLWKPQGDEERENRGKEYMVVASD